MRILVIEDDADIRSICEHIFAWAGHDVASAVDGEPGLELVGSFEPDVIALDIMMPGIDGLAVLAALRGSVTTQDIPVVVVSARTLNADRLRAFEAGADEYVSKPFDPNVSCECSSACVTVLPRSGPPGDWRSCSRSDRHVG